MKSDQDKKDFRSFVFWFLLVSLMTMVNYDKIPAFITLSLLFIVTGLFQFRRYHNKNLYIAFIALMIIITWILTYIPISSSRQPPLANPYSFIIVIGFAIFITVCFIWTAYDFPRKWVYFKGKPVGSGKKSFQPKKPRPKFPIPPKTRTDSFNGKKSDHDPPLRKERNIKIISTIGLIIVLLLMGTGWAVLNMSFGMIMGNIPMIQADPTSSVVIDNSSTGGSFENQWIKFNYPSNLTISDQSTNNEILVLIYNGTEQIGAINEVQMNIDEMAGSEGTVETKISGRKGLITQDNTIETGFSSLFTSNNNYVNLSPGSGKSAIVFLRSDTALSIAFMNKKDDYIFDPLINTLEIKKDGT